MPKIGYAPTARLIQSPPFCVQIELVEGCNLRCDFCGLNGIRRRENDYKFANESTLQLVATSIANSGWRSRIEFAMHGEPSLHPNLIGCLAIFRKALPKSNLMVTSNGAGYLKDINLVDATLNLVDTLALDWYENVTIVPRILERYNGAHQVLHYPQNRQANPHSRYKGKRLVVVQDIAKATKGTHANINNHCGCGAPLDYSTNGKRCAKPFRELSIRYDGNVALCCNDWRGAYVVGNTATRGVEYIWQHPAMQAARKKLYHGLRDFGPCLGCNALSYRPGLLPDQKGKQVLPLPGPADLQAIQRATTGKLLALPVLRPWEVGVAQQKPPSKATGGVVEC